MNSRELQQGLFIVFTAVLTIQAAPDTENVKFPEDFLIGASTSAYQIEGASNIDGRGPSIRDTQNAFDQTGGVTADSYYFYEEDINAIKSIGLTHYRFSISWSRVLPDGSLGNINQLGVAYYNKLIDGLVKNNIKPVVTMLHGDLPQIIQDLGGFTSNVAVDYFESFADLLFGLFGDRVKTWITFNEPDFFCVPTYGVGDISPAVKPFSGFGEYLCGHNVLKAHATAYRLYQKKYADRQKGEIGISLNARFFYSDTNDEYAVKTAQAFKMGWFADPIFSVNGDYPAIMRDHIDLNSIREGQKKSRLPVFSEYWIEQIQGSADFMGLNYYTSRYVELLEVPTGPNPSFERDRSLSDTVKPEWKHANTDFLYSVPTGLGDLLRYIKEQYGNPKVFITENGWSNDGELEDPDRIDYISAHLLEVLNAITQNACNVIGYTVWSLIDTFEAGGGLEAKFGLFAVNFTSPEKTRTPRASSAFIRKVISTRIVS